MRNQTLALLFERYRDKGDGRALAAVFDATAKELLDLACHLVRDPAEAEDVVQATFLTAIQKAASFDGTAPLQAWLYGILWREAAKARRRAARAVDPRRLGERTAEEPQALAAEHELPAAVGEALARLPDRYREVLQPFLFDERRPEGIARELRRSPGTVRSQIHRGLEELRRRLAPRFAAYGALALPTRGLAQLRARVLESAGFATATAATSSVAAAALTLGGALMAKVVLVGAVTAAALVTWIAFERSDRARAAAGTALVERDVLSSVTNGLDAAAASRPLDTSLSERSSAPAAEAPKPSLDATIAYWRARFAEKPDDWRHGWKVAEELANLPPDESLAILSAVWPELSVPVKEQVLKPFVFHGGLPNALPILHLAATDAAPSVQARAFEYLKSYAFADFALDYDAYLHWAEANVRRPVADVVTDAARRFVTELLALAPAQRVERMRGLGTLDLRAGEGAGVDLAATMRTAGALSVLEATLADPDPSARVLALDWSRTLQGDERWLRAWVLPAIEAPDSVPLEVLMGSLGALARKDCGWASEAVFTFLERTTLTPNAASSVAGRVLAEIAEPAAIPRMIELVLHDRTGKLAYDVGYFGLAGMTGVTWQENHDGEWWAAWWEKNRRRFPPEVAALEVRR